MVSKIIIFVALLLQLCHARDILIGSTTVEDDDILRRALETKLLPLGIKEVDVDDYKNQEGVYKVTLTTDSALDQENRANLNKALNDLGFSNVRIETLVLQERDEDGVESEFLVHLNPSKLLPVLKTLGKEVFAVRDIPSPFK